MSGYLERLKSQKTATHGTAKTAKRGFDSKDSDRGRYISEIPTPEPPGMGPEYADLWNRAWTLADYIDNPDGAPLAERRAKLPELEDLRARMAEIEKNPDTCRACGESKWWRLDKPDSKWICGRCHPPAQGLDLSGG